MALTSVTVTKKSVSKSMDGQWSITWTLEGFDGAESILGPLDFSEDYKTGDNITRIEAGFVEQMQNAINKYKKEQFLFNHAQMDTSLGVVQAALEV